MAYNKRDLLRKIFRGEITEKEARAILSGDSIYNPIVIVIETSDGLYRIGDEIGLTGEEVKVRVKGRMHVTVSEKVARLGDPVPGEDDDDD